MIPCYRTHGSRQQINKSIQEEFKICVLVTEAYDYVVQFTPYQGAKKGKQFVSCTKWEIWKNVGLWLMECLTSTYNFDIFMDNYFTYFRLLTHLEATEMYYANSLLLEETAAKKRNVTTMNSAHQAKQQCNFDSNWLELQQVTKRQSWKKVYSRATTKSTPQVQPEHWFCQMNGPERGQVQNWYPNEKMVVVPVCLNGRSCSLLCMVIISY